MEIQPSKIFGLRAIIEAINAGSTIEKLYVLKGLKSDLYHELSKLIKEHHLTLSYVPVEKLNKLSKFQNHQGVVATISPIAYANLESIIEDSINNAKNPLFLLLDQITDVRNFGAIIRTAECTGVTAIIIQASGNAPLNAETIKTSAGAAFKVPICRVDHIKDAIFMLQASGIKIVVATEKTENSIYSVNFKQPTGLIMGSEHKGITTSILKLADTKAKIPLLGEIESLNVSVACAVFLYEAVRQKEY